MGSFPVCAGVTVPCVIFESEEDVVDEWQKLPHTAAQLKVPPSQPESALCTSLEHVTPLSNTHPLQFGGRGAEGSLDDVYPTALLLTTKPPNSDKPAAALFGGGGGSGLPHTCVSVPWCPAPAYEMRVLNVSPDCSSTGRSAYPHASVVRFVIAIAPLKELTDAKVTRSVNGTSVHTVSMVYCLPLTFSTKFGVIDVISYANPTVAAVVIVVSNTYPNMDHIV